MYISDDKLKKIVSEAMHKVLKEDDNSQTSGIDNILKECSSRHFKEIKYFSPTEQRVPTGVAFTRGGFIHECQCNKNAFHMTEAISDNQYGLKNYRGGIIVFSTDVNAVRLDINNFRNKIKQLLATFNQRINKLGILHKVLNKFNKYNEEYIGAYSVGNFFHGRYIGDNGEVYDERSLTLEVNGLSSKALLYLGEMIARVFKQECVLIKDLNNNKIYSANGIRSKEDPNFDSVNAMA